MEVAVKKVIRLDSEGHPKRDQHKEDVKRKSDVDNFVNVALFESVATLVQDLLRIFTCKNYKHK